MYKEFEIVGKRPDRQNDVLKCSFFNQRLGIVETLFRDGTRVQRSPYPEEEERVWTLIIDKKRPFVNEYGETEAGRYVNYIDFKFVPRDELPRDASEGEKFMSDLYGALYNFLKEHDHVIVNDASNTNTNSNCRHYDYLFVDKTEKLFSEKRRHELRVVVGKALIDIYNKSKDEFISLAYACGIPGIDEGNLESLYNQMALKADIMPEYIHSLIESQDVTMIALVNKGLNKNIGRFGSFNTAIEETTSGAFVFEGEIIATSREELVRFFKFNDAKARALRTLLGENKSKGEQVVISENSESVVPIKKNITPRDSVDAEIGHENRKKAIYRRVASIFKGDEEKRDELLKQIAEDFRDLDFYVLERVNAERKRLKMPELHEITFKSQF